MNFTKIGTPRILSLGLALGLAWSATDATAAEPSATTASTSMKITTFYATEAGESRFREIEIPFSTSRDDGFGHRLVLSNAFASPNVQFIELPAGMDQDWHHAPARQLVMVLAGVIEVETSDGVRKQWQAGDVFLPADLSGRGHRTRCIGGAVRLLFAPLPDGFDIETWSTP
jgi:quercetin dioxygenase-like cupin family protein